MGPFLLVLAVLGLALLAYFGWRAEQQRTEALRALATELGFRFHPGPDRSHDDEYEHFELFRRGHSRVASNTLSGTLDCGEYRLWVKAGDFRYQVTTGSGKNQSTTTYRFSYLIAHLPFRGLPTLLIRPEGFFDRVAGAFGFDDIDFESERFSREFFVKSSDKRFAYDVIHPRMMEFLLDAPRTTLDLEEDELCVCEDHARWEPLTFRARLSFVRSFVELWPEHLVAGLRRR